MPDVHDKKTRSYNMSMIKSSDTKPEMIVRKYLHANGLRYSLHNKSLYDKPDITLNKYHTVILVHGCFWHGHDNCKYFVVPKTRKKFWLKKIEGNKLRDTRNSILLKNDGWNVLTIYECELKKERQKKTLNKILINIKNKMEN